MDNISIVTAFFDIGRGNISTQDYPSYLQRSNNTYFEYFRHLATLDNEMVIFTTKEFKQKILEIRQGKPTKVVVFDFPNKLKRFRQKISQIQQNPAFIDKINPEQRKNIEYWSADYVMINNLKTYFVNKAIADNLVSHNQVAWVDFGYVRDTQTLNNITVWQYAFKPDKVHLFNIFKNFKNINSFDKVQEFIFNNRVFLIGGCIVATQQQWQSFLSLLFTCQKQLLSENIVDDDQGLYVMCLFKKPELFQINYLGKENWFGLFQRFDKTSKISLKQKIKDLF